MPHVQVDDHHMGKRDPYEDDGYTQGGKDVSKAV